jgi:hypothetical protein
MMVEGGLPDSQWSHLQCKAKKNVEDRKVGALGTDRWASESNNNANQNDTVGRPDGDN